MRTCLYLLVFFAVIVAGCVQSETKVQNQDLLRISSTTVTPSTIVAPNEIITIRMKLENIGQEDVKFVKSVKLADTATYVPIPAYMDMADFLYDYCSSLYTDRKLSVIANGFDYDETFNGFILKPGRSSLLEWTVKAPDEERIARMKQECPFKFQVNYLGGAKTFTYVYFANPVEKEQRIYTNKDMNLKGENVANFGPVFLNFETAQEQPIKGSSDGGRLNFWTFYVNAFNTGQGIGKIQANTNALSIEVPKSMQWLLDPGSSAVMEKNCPFFKYVPPASSDANTGGRLQYNAETEQNRRLLKLYSQQTSRFSCTLPAPVVSVLDPYLFVSSSDYVYTIDKEIKITTIPKR